MDFFDVILIGCTPKLKIVYSLEYPSLRTTTIDQGFSTFFICVPPAYP